MDEKNKISLPKRILETLKKDCADFRILKESGQPNFNAFINTLIVNFYQSFSAHEEKLHDEVKKALAVVPEYYRERAFQEVVKIYAKRSDEADAGQKKQSVTFSFKPTKASQAALVYIEHVLLQNESLSSFYRRMLVAYTQKTKNEREKIIHKIVYETLENALKKGVQVCLTLQSGEVVNNLSIHSLASSKDELFNYVLAYDGKKNITLRLAGIACVSPLPQTAFIPAKKAALFDKQVACAAQYPIYETDDEPIKVLLTEKGKQLFEKIYLYRPTPIAKEGDVYVFDCSATQLLYYFERFGDHALILSPKRLGIFMRNYYFFAYKKYRDQYPKF